MIDPLCFVVFNPTSALGGAAKLAGRLFPAVEFVGPRSRQRRRQSLRAVRTELHFAGRLPRAATDASF